jgi:gas vesicle protein
MKAAFWLIMSGVAIGILLAPDKGSVTWQKLVNRFNDLKGEASDRVNDMKDKGKYMVNQAIDLVEKESEKW